VVKALVFVVVSWGLRFESSWVQTILWGQLAREAGVLPDPCGGNALYRSEVYLTRVGIRSGLIIEGFIVIIIIIKKKKNCSGFGDDCKLEINVQWKHIKAAEK
jgi:hypothetical protein